MLSCINVPTIILGLINILSFRNLQDEKTKMTSGGTTVGPGMPANDGWQRVGPLVEVRDVLRDFGVDPAEVLTEAGLAADVLDDSRNTITRGGPTS
jgi:hypothetical protein